HVKNGQQTFIHGNYFGLNSNGQQTGTGTGIRIDNSKANVIGGTTAADRNVFGTYNFGIDLEQGADTNLISGNYIGIDPTGNAALPHEPSSSGGIVISGGIG